jgi:hypothetical protein
MKRKLTGHVIRYFILNIGTLILIALMLFVYRASAAPNGPAAPDATPGTISYQGMLNDAAGQPINGSTNITFRLYSAPTGGTALWTEAHTGANAVPVSNGLFNVLLGSLTPIPASVWSNANVYLGVQVGGDAEMSPREIIGSVPTAHSIPDGSVNTVKLADGAITGDKISDNLFIYKMTQQIPVLVNGTKPDFTFQVNNVDFPVPFPHKTLSVEAWLNVPDTYLGVPIAQPWTWNNTGFAINSQFYCNCDVISATLSYTAIGY